MHESIFSLDAAAAAAAVAVAPCVWLQISWSYFDLTHVMFMSASAHLSYLLMALSPKKKNTHTQKSHIQLPFTKFHLFHFFFRSSGVCVRDGSIREHKTILIYFLATHTDAHFSFGMLKIHSSKNPSMN